MTKKKVAFFYSFGLDWLYDRPTLISEHFFVFFRYSFTVYEKFNSQRTVADFS
jgi:hypothetical protein